ncbi:ubiquinol-cytochrome c reductase iron-sulfur subunit [Hydrogenophaga sp.]|uniref:ubiquinol-cytochrome c reductase iron-sulfur subunit n=1 Tax=Hydrogenophaga sp. TaxID=1904254 RepID=UPI00272F5913|nr:ubiquinol-cytochrome c reductase iron-sulfur subunit [Hydrogenophaga sp.]MDP2406027.1 ubiquinol-cytochrome c reductase iron-sulfur subunit [Hydrogenophaga sp.]MDP3886862.1 ubiquinol-cytochrome c reductase iron-sulfur subunit [Hydrogenophaga sp.]MDZ4177223.1 ubiquinol-cytochrome c reductase iron-sulfur subunit [Hydrogenophaga sp.]MDZ4356629.1 ubiquinol-cytochrome c reductase iron-sulfur subunit [Variovorax sp.]
MSHAPALPLPPESGMDPERRTWLLATSAMGVAATAAVAVPFVSSFAPSERAKAQGAAVTMDPTTVAVGEVKTVEWRGQPVWVMRRTPEMLASLDGITDLADPASKVKQQPDYATNTHRSIKPEVFVTVGICTHLGCSPVTLPEGTANPSVPADWKGGFFCPCHGSTFDFAGRVFNNKPAPTNLVVPPHKYLADGSLLIGEDDSGVA